MRPRKPDRSDPEQAADERRIRQDAVALLARREHSARELRLKLARRGYDPGTCDRVVADLERRRLVSDDRFVESTVSHRSGRGQGPVRIRAELSNLGIDGGRVDAALESAGIDWDVLAAAVRRRRFGPAPPRDYAERAKQARFLQYRGFTQEQIRAALAATGPDDDFLADDRP